MNTVQIKNFLAIAEIGSFTKAEEILNTTKTALKKQIDTMEVELEFPLFVRSSKGLYLTRPGELFYDRVKGLYQSYQDTVSECKEIYFSNKREIRIGMYSITDMMNWYMEVERKSHFKIQQIMSTANTHEHNFGMLMDGSIDFLEYEDNEQLYRRGFCYTKIIEDDLCCIMSPNHALASQKAIHPEDLCGYRIYCWTSKSSATRALYEYADKLNWKLKGLPYSVGNILNVCNEGNIYILSHNSAAMFQPLRVIPIVPRIPYYRGLVYKPEKESLLQEMLHAAKPERRMG